ncbi:DUF3772 domain-containing protein [Pseudomonas sp. BN415]|uniref:DUF3772 domain-containing protein n=1 Tax=Pseudomonas sp. BN415 TaxID=2567889 RepID=UPI0032AFF5A0
MQRVSPNGLLLALTFWILAVVCVPFAQAEPAAMPSELPVLAEGSGLGRMSDQLDLIRQKVAGDSNDDFLLALRQAAMQVQRLADAFSDLRSADIERVDDQLKVLGPEQAGEAENLASQRQQLMQDRVALLDEQRQANQLVQSAADLSAQISNLRRSLFNSQISTRVASPLSPKFWSQLVPLSGDDLSRLRGLWADASSMLHDAFSSERNGLFIASLVASGLLWSVGRYLLERLLAWSMIRWLPEGRMRRTGFALGVGLISLITIGGAVSLSLWGLESSAQLPPSIATLGSQLMSVVVFCACVTGLGRALLMPSRPSWRLPPVPNPVASALAWFPPLLALALVIVVTQDRINSVIASSLALTVATYGLTAFVTALLFAVALLRYQYVRRRSGLGQPQGIAGLMAFVASAWVGFILAALFIGYLSLAYFLTVKLLWISVVAASAYLVIAFYGDFCEALFSPRLPGGLALASAFGLPQRHQAQLSTLLTGLGRSLLLFIAVMLALLPSGSSPGDFLGVNHWRGLDKPLWGLNILPQDILLAVGFFLVGLQGIRVLKRWLSDELLPDTNLDTGMRASLVTLVGYLGFILLAVVVLSTVHIDLSSLTWVISALSVGIGFGLQAIVQNFISGLILLTERPVKVGDWVSLDGVEGDIRRINVRATEIQMSDHSTVIVPNSQFISLKVRNVTMESALGVVGIHLTLPLDTDMRQVRDLLLKVYGEHAAILETPAPSVRLNDLASNGIILTVTGYVSGPRLVSDTRSDLLFTILEALREQKIALSSPQSLRLIEGGQDGDGNQGGAVG